MSRYLGTRGRSSLAVSVCDRCQLKVRYVDLTADGNSPGLRVCRKCHDPIDRWRLPPRQTEIITLQHPRPEQNIQADQPVASFTMSTTSGFAPLTVTFTDTSTGSPTGWAWDFTGDGVVDSTVQNPTYIYASPGLYSVTLVTSNASGAAQARVLAAIQVTVPPTPTDQFWANVVLLMHFDGDYTDSSSLAQAFSNTGTTLSAAGAKFTQSVSPNGTNPGGGGTSIVKSDVSRTEYDLNASDFTMEAWVYSLSTVTSSVNPIVSLTKVNDAIGMSLSLYGNGTGTSLRLDYEVGAGIQSIASATGAIVTGTWYHVAATRSGNTYHLFIDGVQVSTVNDASRGVVTAHKAKIGNFDGQAGGLHGIIDEVRVTKGVARYTATFTPPTAPFPNG